MLKKRTFWFGLGSGIMIGTLLLQLMIWGQEQEMELTEDVTLPVMEEDMYSEKQVEEIRADVREEVLAELELPPHKQDKEVLVRGFIVQSGMNSQDVTDLLLQLQLIEDKEQFKRLLAEGKKDTRIRAGIYHFAGHPSPEEIVERITPLDER